MTIVDLLKQVVERFSSYKLFNFFLPGAVMYGVLRLNGVVALDILKFWELLIVIYFMGLLCSRVGSVVIEEIMKRFNWIKGYDIKKYLEKQNSESMIVVLLEICNTYRTFAAVFLILPFVHIVYGAYLETLSWSVLYYVIPELLIMILFCFSFYKQYCYFQNSIK